jgi:hypothetical protein
MRHCLALSITAVSLVLSATAQAQWPVKLEVEVRLLTPSTAFYGEPQVTAIAVAAEYGFVRFQTPSHRAGDIRSPHRSKVRSSDALFCRLQSM